MISEVIITEEWYNHFSRWGNIRNPSFAVVWQFMRMMTDGAVCNLSNCPLALGKGKDGHLVHVWNANLGTLLPPWAWVTGYARTPENRYNQMQLASDCCSMWKDIFQFLPKKNRGGGGSNPRRKRRDGNTSDALTTTPRLHASLRYFLDLGKLNSWKLPK